jgi:hypothetical protein
MANSVGLPVKTVVLVSLLIAGAVQAETAAPGSGSSASVPAPGGTAPGPVGPIKPLLYGVIYGERGWIAYIEDPTTRGIAAYRIGDTVAGQTIEAIEEERVVLKGPEGALEIRLSDEKPGAPQRPR